MTTAITTQAQQTLSQQTQDVAGEQLSDARYIGPLQPRQTRINLSSALTTNDKVDYYTFRVTEAGQIGLNFTGDNIRVQMVTASGRVIADSKATSGSAKDNWTKLSGTNYQAAEGSYYLKITRTDGTSPSDKIPYSLQARIGQTFKTDYDTTETPAPAATQSTAAGPSASMLATQGITNLLLDANDPTTSDTPISIWA